MTAVIIRLWVTALTLNEKTQGQRSNCKDKYKLKIRGLILPFENERRDSPPFLFLAASTLGNL